MRAGIGAAARRAGSAAAAVLLLAVACSSESDVFRPAAESATTATEAPGGDTELTAPVTGEGATLTLDGGAAVVVPPGALPAGTMVTAGVAPDGGVEFPAAATPVGTGLSIAAPEQPTAPVLVEIPVPPGEATDDLYLLHYTDDGSYEYVGGAVEDGVFVTAIRSFSEAWVVHLAVSKLLGLPDIDLPTLYGGEEMPSSQTHAEAVALATGELEEPFPRVVGILGPGELPAGADGLYQATGFETRWPEFAAYDWRVYGGSGLVLESAEFEAARFTAAEPGRYTLTVEAYDPATGASAFAARRVFVTEEALVLWAVPDADGYGPGRRPVVTMGLSGGVPPVEVEWAVDAGETGSATAEAVPWETAVTLAATAGGSIIRVSATDAGGDTAEVAVPLPVQAREGLVMITGPRRVQVGETAAFSALTTPDVDPASLIWQVFPAADSTGEGTSLAVTWGEPGLARLRLIYNPRDEEGEAAGPGSWDDLVVDVAGPAEPVRVLIAEGPESLNVGEEGVWRLRARGGMVAPSSGFRGYVATIDFGGGTVLGDIPMPAETATRLCPFVEVRHSYQEAGDYEVEVTVADGAGNTAQTTQLVTVSARIVAVGEFIVPTVVPVEVVENRIRIVIDSGQVRIPRLDWYTITGYTGFEVGDDDTFEAPCKNHSRWELLELDAAYDPATGTITGTAIMLWDRVDVGTECPFGGMDVEQTRTMALEATLAGGVIEGTFRAADALLPESVGMAFEATVDG